MSKLEEALNTLYEYLSNRKDVKDICIQLRSSSKNRSRMLVAEIEPDFFDVQFHFGTKKKKLVLFADTRICTIYPGNVKASFRFAEKIKKEEKGKKPGFDFKPACYAGNSKITEDDIRRGRYNIGRVEFSFEFGINESIEKTAEDAIWFINDQLYKYYSSVINEAMREYNEKPLVENEEDRMRSFLQLYLEEALNVLSEDETQIYKIDSLKLNRDMREAICDFIIEGSGLNNKRQLERIAASSSMHIKVVMMHLIKKYIEFEKGELNISLFKDENKEIREKEGNKIRIFFNRILYPQQTIEYEPEEEEDLGPDYEDLKVEVVPRIH